ncbi:hypothetical protein ACFSTI_20680 [Rhizorhabdus histidinilytica]|uniref:Uncharacterized protein n=1 Tax=Rhizorhabdus histidinilytica TaxID=439228 RepID=A0A1T5BP94_9SPHN|nr:hypothetical protein [Rhizorhabdus histidinilytica]SKB48967.1 hypothetical protein SAMN06295920_103167 [Rhizorhabdus histidinilytica]
MAGVNAEIALSIAATLVGTGDLGNPKLKIDPISELLQLVPGTDAVNKADILFADTRTVGASSSEDLDLAGELANAFGATITAAEVVAIFIKAHESNTNNVVVGAATAAFPGPLGATGTYTIKPGEYYLAVSRSGWAVGAGTTDDLKIANSGGTTGVTYDILVIGRTVAA